MSKAHRFRSRAVAGALCAAIGSAGFMVPATAGPVSFSVSGSVTDGESAGATTSAVTPSTTVQLQGFDAVLGVLTGANLQLSSQRQQTTTVTVQAGTFDNGNNNQQTATGTGSSGASLSGPGLSATLAPVTQSANCTAGRKDACTATSGPVASTADASFTVASLDSYVTPGKVGITASLPQLQALLVPGPFKGTETTTYAVEWVGTLDLTYAYLLHAAASFSADGLQTVLDIDFGTVVVGSTATRAFSLFNLAGDRVGLDLDGVTGSGAIDRLTTDLAVFDALAAGTGSAFQAALDTSTEGLFEASYLLQLSDADVGAEASRHAYTLTLSLRGNVVAPTTQVRVAQDVPEPASLALLGVGLAALGVARRRRR